jgi:hypothetical protein
VNGGSVKIIAISEIFKVPVNVYFVFEVQITQPLTVTVGQVVTERNLYLLFNGQLDSDHYGAVLPVKIYKGRKFHNSGFQ